MRKQKDRLPYGKWEQALLSNAQIGKLKEDGKKQIPDEIWINGRYEVWVHRNMDYGEHWPKTHWLSIKRGDKEPIRSWRDLQRIKNDLIGDEHEAVELFPAESRLADTSNQYHLWVLADKAQRFPFGYVNRLVTDGHDGESKQAAWEKKPVDVVTFEEMGRLAEEEREKVADRKQNRATFKSVQRQWKKRQKTNGLKAWCRVFRPRSAMCNRTVVIAKSQKRALELLREAGDNLSRQNFRDQWTEGAALTDIDRRIVDREREGVWVKDGPKDDEGSYREITQKLPPSPLADSDEEEREKLKRHGVEYGD